MLYNITAQSFKVNLSELNLISMGEGRTLVVALIHRYTVREVVRLRHGLLFHEYLAPNLFSGKLLGGLNF